MNNNTIVIWYDKSNVQEKVKTVNRHIEEGFYVASYGYSDELKRSYYRLKRGKEPVTKSKEKWLSYLKQIKQKDIALHSRVQQCCTSYKLWQAVTVMVNKREYEIIFNLKEPKKD